MAGVALLALGWVWWRAWSPLVACDAAGQAWHLATSTFVSRGRRGAWGHPLSFGVANVALLALGWVWWRAWSLLVAVSRPFCRGTLRGRRAPWRHPSFHVRTWRHAPSFDVAGAVLLALGWVWWRAWSLLVARDAAALCVAGAVLGDIHLRFTWQASTLVTFTFVLRGRRGTFRHPPSLSVAGVVLIWHWAGSGGALGRTPRHFAVQVQVWHLATSTFVLRGRRGTWERRGSVVALTLHRLVVRHCACVPVPSRPT